MSPQSKKKKKHEKLHQRLEHAQVNATWLLLCPDYRKLLNSEMLYNSHKQRGPQTHLKMHKKIKKKKKKNTQRPSTSIYCG